MLRARTNDALVDGLLHAGVLRTPGVIQAFRRVDRACFVPDELVGEAYGDYPLPIGFGQTISQPTTVAFMLELVCPKPGERALEVGSGSGYVLALLSRIVGVGGRVQGIERIPELAQMSRRNLKRAGITGVRVAVGDGSRAVGGLCDVVIVSAAAATLPASLRSRLAQGGRLAVPVGEGYQEMVCIERAADGFRQARYPGFRFVPLVTD